VVPTIAPTSPTARHEGDHVIIEIRDDGRGIDVARVRPKAIGGSVELQSEHGRGTTVRIRIPLTLAIISALLVGTAGATFAVPQIGIVELVHVTEEQHHLLESVHGAQFHRLRDSLLPLVALHTLLGLAATSVSDTSSLVVCQVGDTRFGLVVDEVFDTAEIVVKPIGRRVKLLQVNADCTITGDGRVIMILDPAGVAASAAISSRSTSERAAQADAAARRSDDATETVLLFDAGYDVLQAVPLAVVARLEEFTADAFEQADGQYLVQCRGSLMPILPANPATQRGAEVTMRAMALGASDFIAKLAARSGAAHRRGHVWPVHPRRGAHRHGGRWPARLSRGTAARRARARAGRSIECGLGHAGRGRARRSRP
jgi:two-component system chemotaxis sensor kinase CheA